MADQAAAGEPTTKQLNAEPLQDNHAETEKTEAFPDPKPSRQCAVCNELTKKHCSICKSTYYCSRSCQNKDYALHSLLCQDFEAFLKTRPASGSFHYYKLCIHFPVDSSLPTLGWVQCTSYSVEAALLRPDRTGCGSDRDDHRYFMPNWADLRMERCNRGYNLQFIPTFQDLRSKGGKNRTRPNLCIQSLTNGYQLGGGLVEKGSGSSLTYKNPLKWTCPIILLATNIFPGRDPNNSFRILDTMDVILADLRSAVDFFVRNAVIFDGAAKNPFIIRRSDDWVKAVKINCVGEVKKFREKYRQVEIHPDFLVFDPEIRGAVKVPGNSDRPLLIRKCNTDLSKLRVNTPQNPSYNPEVESMILCAFFKLNPEETVLNVPRLKDWQAGDIGTVLVAWPDKRNLTVHQVEAMAWYYHAFVMPAIKEGFSNPNLSPENRESNEHIIKNYKNRKSFEEFFDFYKKKKMSEGDLSWADSTSHYGLPHLTKNHKIIKEERSDMDIE